MRFHRTELIANLLMLLSILAATLAVVLSAGPVPTALALTATAASLTWRTRLPRHRPAPTRPAAHLPSQRRPTDERAGTHRGA
ncbi:hypothetical protein [Streptomyces mangrovisoli]|uniref:Uncharacterized protein n=1 Tax=Streptomyces mangrovisoli TaxID=1428628 RepID=A0A1J4NVU3_9ACTN|nr:hypothetical protein [Streptomyces mangrovisoli]OIJ65628.1 hypothetical protein WN71_022570 [Streptomyces mangrovisoli]